MQSGVKKVLHSIKESAVRIALVQPRVSFKVVDMESEDELLCTHASSSPLSLLCDNFGIGASSLHELSFSEDSLKLEGYVSSHSSSFPSKAVQYIYINSRFIAKGPIHKILNHLAEMCWDQLSCDKGGKRSQPNLGPMYCLNLRCPSSSYDLNLEFSRATVEFKDWSPVLAFIEQSVASLWSRRTKMEEHFNSDVYQIGNRFEEKILGNRTSAEKDWLLRTCEKSKKRRRIQSNGDDQESTKFSPCSRRMHLEDDSELSAQKGIGSVCRKLQRDVIFEESETKREFCNLMASSQSACFSPSVCKFTEKDDDVNHLLELHKEVISFNDDLLETDVTNRKRDVNFGECYLSSSRWRDEHRVDDFDSRSGDIDSEWNFVLRQEKKQMQVTEDPKFLHDLVQPLDYEKNNTFQIGNANAKRCHHNSMGIEHVNDCSQASIFLGQQCKNQPDNVWSSREFNIESDMWKDLNTSSTKNDLLSFEKEHASESLSKQDGDSSNTFSLDTDHPTGVSYPFFSSWDLEHEHLIPNEGLERRCKVRTYDDIESKDDKGKFYRNYFADRLNYVNYSLTSCLNSSSLFESDYDRLQKGAFETSPGWNNIDDMTPVRYGDYFEDTYLPCIDQTGRDCRRFPSVYQNVSKVQMDRRQYQSYDSENMLRERLGRGCHGSPSGLLSSRCYDTVADEIFSPHFDFQKKLNTPGLSVPSVSPVSSNDFPMINRQRCQVREPNGSFSEQTGRTCVRLRRSHSAPPVHRGKKKFLSVMNCLFSAAEIPASHATPQDSIPGRAELEYPLVSTLVDHEHPHREMNYTRDPFQNVKETYSIMQVSTLVRDDITETACSNPGSSRIKWQGDFGGAAEEDIANKQKVGDTFTQIGDETEILDVHSCLLHLAGDSLIPKSINRNCLEKTKVLSQVDNKFIPVVASGILTVIDQHAADERIRLEEMRQKVFSGELKSVTYLHEEKDLVLPEMAYQLLYNYAEHIKHWGWICNIFSQDSGFAKNLNLLNAQPTLLKLLAVPCILGVNLSDVDLLEFIEQLADTDGSSTIPPSVIRVLNSKACRGAIMFGDKLLPSECSLIVEELKRTSLCFQCAYGRPTTVPLVNLEALHEGISHLRSWNGKGSNDSWHGLRREDINMRRAKFRLDVARGCGRKK